VPEAGLEPALPCGKGILSRDIGAMGQRLVDSLPFLITRVTGSDRILRALWTPRWTPEFCFDENDRLEAEEEWRLRVLDMQRSPTTQARKRPAGDASTTPRTAAPRPPR